MSAKPNKADVVIAGAGLSGMVTAFELLNLGKSVILLDREEEKYMGGLAKESFGGIFFVNSRHQQKRKIKDSTELALKDWHSFAEFGADDHWPKAWAEQYVHQCTPLVYNWLREHGIKFFPVVHWVERGLIKQGNSVPRFHMVWGTGYGLVETMKKHLLGHTQRAKLDLRFGHKVEEIISDSSGAKGFSGKKESSGEGFEVYGENVVVATGGICGNIALLKQNWHKDLGTPPEKILNGSHHYADGTLHAAVRQLQGNVTHMDIQWNYAAGVHHPDPHPKRPLHGLSIVPPKSALWVRPDGRRYGPRPLVSAFDTRYLVEQISKEAPKYSWQIMNRRIALKELAVSGSQFNDAIREKKLFQFLKTILFGNKKLVNYLTTHCKDFIVADSLEELVGKMNALTDQPRVSLEVLRADIEAYDDQIRRGESHHTDEQLKRIAQLRSYRGDRVRTCNFQRILDPKAMPLIAIREFILSRKTLGGIQTDLDGRVMGIPRDGQQEAIPGLYAVGEAAGFGGGGVHGLRALEGTFLGGCLLTGRRAAYHIGGRRLE